MSSAEVMCSGGVPPLLVPVRLSPIWSGRSIYRALMLCDYGPIKLKPYLARRPVTATQGTVVFQKWRWTEEGVSELWISSQTNTPNSYRPSRSNEQIFSHSIALSGNALSPPR
jgi:hypothetical protein